MEILRFDSAAAPSLGQLAERRLRESPYFFLKRLTCECQTDVLTVRGTVPFHQLKDIAETILERVEGVRMVVNQVEVYDPMSAPSGAQAVRNAG